MPPGGWACCPQREKSAAVGSCFCELGPLIRPSVPSFLKAICTRDPCETSSTSVMIQPLVRRGSDWMLSNLNSVAEKGSFCWGRCNSEGFYRVLLLGF